MFDSQVFLVKANAQVTTFKTIFHFGFAVFDLI